MNQKKECNDFIQFINKSVKIIDKKYYTEYIKELKIITNNFIKDTKLSNENINYIGPIDLHLGESMNKNKTYPFYILKNNYFIQADRTDSNIRGNGYQN